MPAFIVSVPGRRARGMRQPSVGNRHRYVETTRASQDRRISGGKRFGAFLVSAFVGLGVGHCLMGFTDVGEAFLKTQLAGASLSAVSIAVLEPGDSLSWASVAVYGGLRVWGLADVVIRGRQGLALSISLQGDSA